MSVLPKIIFSELLLFTIKGRFDVIDNSKYKENIWRHLLFYPSIGFPFHCRLTRADISSSWDVPLLLPLH